MHNPHNVVSLAQAGLRTKRGEGFTPIKFSFPLTDSLWCASYLRVVRHGVEMVGLTRRDMIERCIATREGGHEASLPAMQADLTRTIVHLEELVELLRTAQSRLRDADETAVSFLDRRARQ